MSNDTPRTTKTASPEELKIMGDVRQFSERADAASDPAELDSIANDFLNYAIGN